MIVGFNPISLAGVHILIRFKSYRFSKLSVRQRLMYVWISTFIQWQKMPLEKVPLANL
jgi:hypothetical protein